MNSAGNWVGRIARWQLACLMALWLTGCAHYPWLGSGSLPMPHATNEFIIGAFNDDVIGEMQIIQSHHEDTLSDIARRFNLGYEEIVAANPAVDPWLPGEGTDIVLPTQWVLPKVRREGIVVNLAAMRLFYFPKQGDGEPRRVITHPVGIGRVEWETPQGTTRVVAKQEAPPWIPTPAIRKEHADNGDPLPAVVPPGPDNPLGTHVMRLGWPEYLIHGTDKPASIGLRGTHGCLRMYPEDIVAMYAQVPVGTPVTIINEPFLAGFSGATLMVQTYPLLEEDKRNHHSAFRAQIRQARPYPVDQQRAAPAPVVDQALLDGMLQTPRALTLPVTARGATVEQLLASVPRVQNLDPIKATGEGKTDVSAGKEFEFVNPYSARR